MTICPKCNGYIGDINMNPFDGHKCPVNSRVEYNNAPIIRTSQKCDICGSTAIDHTENQCGLNRQLNKNRLGGESLLKSDTGEDI